MSRLGRNILWNLAGQAVLLGLGVLAVRFVFRQLGADAFGLILFAQTAGYVLMGVFDLGIATTNVREVAAHFSTDRAYVVDLLRTGALMYWGAYAGLSIALVLAAPLLITHWINLRSIDPGSATLLVQILGAGALLTLPRSLYASFFRGLQAMGVTNLIEAGALALQQLGIILILARGGSVFAVAGWFSATYLLSVIAYVLMSSRVVPWRALLPSYSASVVRRNLSFSLQMMSNSALAMVHGQTDKVLISKLMPISALGTYGFAATLAAGVARATSSIVLAAFPSFSDLFHRTDHGTLMAQYRKVHGLVVYGTAPLFAALTFAGLPLLTYVFGAPIGRQIAAPLALLCVGWYFNATLSAPYVLSVAVGRPDIAARQNLLALFLVLPVATILVLWLGLVGAAMAWIAYHLFAYGYGLPRICRECLKLPLRSWWAQMLRPMVLIAVTYGLAYALARQSSTGVLAAAFVLSSIAYAVGGFAMAGAELRAAVRRSTFWLGRAEAA